MDSLGARNSLPRRCVLRRFGESAERMNRDFGAVGELEVGGASGKRRALRLVLQQPVRGLHHAGRIERPGPPPPRGDTAPRAPHLTLATSPPHAGPPPANTPPP